MPTFELSGPDGGRYQLDAPDEAAALAAFTSLHGGAKAAPDSPISADNIMRSVSHGIPIVGGVADKFAAGMDALTHPLLGRGAPGETISERYSKNVPIEEGKTQAFETAHPNVDLGAKVVGGIAGTAPLIAAAPGAFGFGAGGLPLNMAKGATTAAAIAAPDAMLRGEDPVKAAEFAAGGGAAGPLLGKAIGAGVNKLLDSSLARTATHNELANAAERLGVDFPRVAATDNLVTQRTGSAIKEIPVIGNPIVSASRKASEQMGEALTNVEQGFGSGSSLNAGEVAKTGLVDWITGKSKDVMNRLYGSVDSLINPAVTRPLTATEQMAGKILAERLASKATDAGKAVDLVSNALPATSPQGLTYEGLKTLRTRIGSYLDGSILPEAGTSMPDLKRIYSALTTDLRDTVAAAGGPNALKAFNRANGINQIVSQRRESLAKIVGIEADAAPERVIDRLIGMASGSSRADYQKLLLARKTIGSQNWDEVASAAISRIGRDAEGKFSPDRFLTAFGKLSENGKQTLFGSTGKDNLVQALTDIAKLSSKAKELNRFASTSQSATPLVGLSVLGSMFHSPHVALPTAAASWLAAKGLARPIGVKSSTIRLAAQNADVGDLLEHAIRRGAIGASTSGVAGRTPAQTSQPSLVPIQ